MTEVRIMIRIAIVEDEQNYIDQLTGYIEKYEKEAGEEFSITTFRDGDQIVNGYSGNYEIILMDIQMKFMDGMSAAEAIRKLDSEVIIMFTTNMAHFAIRGYQVDALDYMVKPIEYFSFSQKLNKAIVKINNRDLHYIAVPIEDGMQKMEIENISYVESHHHVLIYHYKGNCINSHGTMTELEETLTPYFFYRSNKGYLVNLKSVEGVKNGCCIIGREQLAISRSKQKPFMEALVNYMGRVIK